MRMELVSFGEYRTACYMLAADRPDHESDDSGFVATGGGGYREVRFDARDGFAIDWALVECTVTPEATWRHYVSELYDAFLMALQELRDKELADYIKSIADPLWRAARHESL